MECEYHGVPREGVLGDDAEERPKILFFRQLFVASGAWTMFFLCGLYLGSPTVIIPQLRKEANSTAAVSFEMASWLSSISSYGSIPWEFILPAILFRFGRKVTSIITHLGILVVSTIFYCSSTPSQLLIFEFLQGLPYAGILTTTIVIIAEYTSTEYRGMFLTMKAASFCWGIWVSNAIGTFFHWRCISIVGFICSLYTLTVFFWPESPFWLASKGQYEKCKIAHRWLKGIGKNSENELEGLMNCQTRSHIKSKCFVRHFLRTLVSKDFYYPVILCSLTIVSFIVSGRIVCNMYAIDILIKITGVESAAYAGMLILDGVSVFSMYIGSILTITLNRRTILLTTSFGTLIFLFILSIYLYLVKLLIINENKYFSISMLAGYFICVSTGPGTLSMSLYGELIPLKHKSFAVVIISLVFSSLQSTLIKIGPYIFRTFKVHGAFLFYAVCSSIITLLIYKYLPETKDKTLQEIEDLFKDHLVDEEFGRKKSVSLEPSMVLVNGTTDPEGNKPLKS